MGLRYRDVTNSTICSLICIVFDCIAFLARLPATSLHTVHGFNRIEWSGNAERLNGVHVCPQDDEEEQPIDPFCVENRPHKITFEDVTSAAFKIKGGIINTPCVVRSTARKIDGKIR